MLEVTQADRDAAALIVDRFRTKGDCALAVIHAAVEEIAAWTAAHRIAAQPATDQVERAREALRRWHRDSCYPDAMDVELEIGIDAIRAALAESGKGCAE